MAVSRRNLTLCRRFAVPLGALTASLFGGCQTTHLFRNVISPKQPQALVVKDIDFQPVRTEPRTAPPIAKSLPVAQLPVQPDSTAPEFPEISGLQLVAGQQVQPQPLPPGLPAADLLDTPPDSQVPSTRAAGLTLPEIEQLALAHNSAIQQGAAIAAKARGIRQQVGRKPNPTVGYQASQLIDRGTDQHLAFIEQDFILGGKLALNERVLDQEVEVQLWEVETQRQRVLTDVRRKFHETLAAGLRRELALDFETVANNGISTAQKRKDIGEATDIEVLQAEIQLNEIELIRQRAEITWESCWRELTALAGVPCLPATTLEGTLAVESSPMDWEARYCQLEANSPQIHAAMMRVARAQLNLQRQQAQPIPNLNVQMASGYDNGTGSSMLNLQVGMPLPVHNANHGNIAAAHAEFCEAGQNLQRLKLSLRQQLAIASRDYDSAAIAVQRYETVILPKARRTLELSERAYSTQGTIDFLQVLVARRTFFDANLQFNQSQLELAQASDLVNGMLLTGGLDDVSNSTSDDSLRGQALSGQ